MNTLHQIDDRTRKMIRDLSSLQGLLTAMDRIGSIEQAEGEALARVVKANEEANAARAEADEAIANAQADAAAAGDSAKAEIATLSTEREELRNLVELTRAEKAAIEEELAQAQAKLQATNNELARIASRIGG
jgi:chromosome segregation ATPase